MDVSGHHTINQRNIIGGDGHHSITPDHDSRIQDEKKRLIVSSVDIQKRFRPQKLFLLQLAFTCYLCIRGISQLTVYQYILRREYSHTAYFDNMTSPHSKCEVNMSNPIYVERESAQLNASTWLLFFSVASGVPSIISCIVLGSYSDRIGRRWLFLIPNFGLLVKITIFVINSYWELDLHVLYAGYITDGICGSFVTIMIGATSSAADTTHIGRQRTLMITVVDLLMGLSYSIADFSSGYMIKGLGYTQTFAILCLLTFANFITMLLMPETKTSHPDDERTSIVQYVKTTFMFYVRPSGRRVLYNVCMLTFLCGVMVFVGRDGVETLYVINSPFCWHPIKIGNVSGIVNVIQAVVTVVFLKVTQRCMTDAAIGAVAAVTCAAAMIMEGLCQTDTDLYIAFGLRILAFLVTCMARTVTSKLTPRHLQGAAQSSLSAAETVIALSGGLLFNGVYGATLLSNAGAVFFIMAAILILCAIGYITLQLLTTRINLRSLTSTTSPSRKISPSDQNYPGPSKYPGSSKYPALQYHPGSQKPPRSNSSIRTLNNQPQNAAHSAPHHRKRPPPSRMMPSARYNGRTIELTRSADYHG